MISARRALAVSLALVAALVAWWPVDARAAGDTSDIVVHARKDGEIRDEIARRAALK